VGVLLSRRTSRRFIAARIVADAEIKLNFLLSKVCTLHLFRIIIINNYWLTVK